MALQPSHPALEHPAVRALAVVLFAVGTTLVVSSMWVLGVTGTYLGDYFGILMDHMVTGFPFNVVGDPMYWGSSANFLATALWYAKPAGIVLSVIVVVTYTVALRYEGYVVLLTRPFTAAIYKQAEERKRVGRQRPSWAGPGVSTSVASPAQAQPRNL